MVLVIPYVMAVLWLTAVLAAARFADHVWSGLLGRIYWVAIAPGVAVHELSHAAGCLVTGAKITRIRLFSPDGGEVEHGPPKLPVVGQTVISMAPIAGCAIALIAVGAVVNPSLMRAMKQMPMSVVASPRGVGAFVEASLGAVGSIAQNIARSNWLSWRTYAFLYAAICLGISLRPSATDFRNSFLGLLGIAALVATADGICRSAWDSTFVADRLLRPAQRPLHFLVAFLGLVFVVTLVVWAIQALLSQFLRRPRWSASRAKDG